MKASLEQIERWHAIAVEEMREDLRGPLAGRVDLERCAKVAAAAVAMLVALWVFMALASQMGDGAQYEYFNGFLPPANGPD